jgi:hypothetical protein
MKAAKAYFIREIETKFLQQINGMYVIFESKESAFKYFKRMHKDDKSRCEVTVSVMDIGKGVVINE